jgi:hypothetical protein
MKVRPSVCVYARLCACVCARRVCVCKLSVKGLTWEATAVAWAVVYEQALVACLDHLPTHAAHAEVGLAESGPHFLLSYYTTPTRMLTHVVTRICTCTPSLRSTKSPPHTHTHKHTLFGAFGDG